MDQLICALSTRQLDQIDREMTGNFAQDVLAGGYWAEPPSRDAEVALVYCGAIVPEVRAAWEMLIEDVPGAGLLAVTSPDVLHSDWLKSGRGAWTGESAAPSQIERLLSQLAPGAGLVTLIDGAPSALSWLGSVDGRRVRALGTERFGQTGDLPDLYDEYRLDAEAILDAAASLLV